MTTATKTHDPLALVAHKSSSSRSPPAYYVTHPSSVVDYDDEYQGETFQNDLEDSLTTVMMLLARAITQRYYTLTNNRLHSSSNTRNQAVVQADKVNILSKNVGNDGRMARRSYNIQDESAESSNVQKEAENVQRSLQTSSNGNDSKYFMEQMLLAKKDEAEVILSNEQNVFLFADAAKMEEFEELNRDKIRALEKERYDLQSNVSEQRKHVFELQNAQTVLKRKMNADEDKYLDNVLNLEEKLKKNEIVKKQNFRSIDYKKLNALYETFVLPIELFAEQKYFSSVSTTSETSSNARTSSSSPTTMPNLSKLMKHFHKMETDFEKLLTLLEINSTPKSIFYTSREDIHLNDFCCKEVKPILNDLHSFFKILLKQFSEEVKTMMHVFESVKSDLDATWKQNEILNDQLLEATLKHDDLKLNIHCFVTINLSFSMSWVGLFRMRLARRAQPWYLGLGSTNMA
ncbi:hypothetical protein Tco_1278050 [Tanacetum coccineum]